MSGGNWKAMFKAIQDNDIELVRFYLNSGIAPNYQHPEFLALPLSESVRYKNLAIFELLLQNGADPSIKEIETGLTVLELAHKLNMQSAIDLLNSFKTD